MLHPARRLSVPLLQARRSPAYFLRSRSRGSDTSTAALEACSAICAAFMVAMSGFLISPTTSSAKQDTTMHRAIPVHSDAEIEQTITSIGREPGGGLVVMPDGFMVVHRRAIISPAARNSVPAVYWQSIFAKDGGLLSYGPDYLDLFRRAALYVDRILHGTKPSELPVQLPVKFSMAINLNAAKGVGLVVPPSILLSADAAAASAAMPACSKTAKYF